jgi:hypothetical protein
LFISGRSTHQERFHRVESRANEAKAAGMAVGWRVEDVTNEPNPAKMAAEAIRGWRNATNEPTEPPTRRGIGANEATRSPTGHEIGANEAMSSTRRGSGANEAIGDVTTQSN